MSDSVPNPDGKQDDLWDRRMSPPHLPTENLAAAPGTEPMGGTAAPGHAPPRPNKNGRAAALVGAALVCLAAWLLPGDPEGVAGRLGYFRLLLALGATVGLVVTVVLVVSPARRIRTVAFRTLAVTLGLVVGLVLWEAAAYLLPAPGAGDNPWYQITGKGLDNSDELGDLPFARPPHLHWEGLSRGDLAILGNRRDPYARPVTFDTDFEGFRNSRDIRRADLVFIGDSYTEAGNTPEEETYVRRTGERLGISTRNLGRAGYTGPPEFIILRDFGLRCKPRMVVWQIAESNDLSEAISFARWIRSGRPRPYYKFHEPTRADLWRQRSPTYQLFSRLKPWPYRGTFTEREGKGQQVWFLPVPLESPAKEEYQPGWPILENSIRQGAALLRTQNIDLTVLLMPDKVRVMGPFCPDLEKNGKRVRAGWDLPEDKALAAYLGRLCRDLAVPFVDATPALRQAAASGELVYLPFDTHLTPRGHVIVSDLLVQALAPALRPPRGK